MIHIFMYIYMCIYILLGCPFVLWGVVLHGSSVLILIGVLISNWCVLISNWSWDDMLILICEPHAPPPVPLRTARACAGAGWGGIPYGYTCLLDVGYWISLSLCLTLSHYIYICIYLYRFCWGQISAPSRSQPEYIGWKTTSLSQKWQFWVNNR